jgi:hypothetical protein
MSRSDSYEDRNHNVQMKGRQSHPLHSPTGGNTCDHIRNNVASDRSHELAPLVSPRYRPLQKNRHGSVVWVAYTNAAKPRIAKTPGRGGSSRPSDDCGIQFGAGP